MRLRDPVALPFVLRTLDAHSDPACLAPPRCGSARQMFRIQYRTYPRVQHSTFGLCSCAQPLPRMPPELERARNWLRPRSVRSGSNPPQLMVPFAAPLAGFSARSRVIGIASPCLGALRLERALPAAVLGPRLRAPLRRLAAICLSVAILMITIGGYR